MLVTLNIPDSVKTVALVLTVEDEGRVAQTIDMLAAQNGMVYTVEDDMVTRYKTYDETCEIQ